MVPIEEQPLVELEWHETLVAVMIGGMRQMQALYHGREERYGASPDLGWSGHIRGTIGEDACAKHFRIYWAGNLGNLYAADVGKRYQVRATEWLDGHLILHHPDKDDAPFILVVGRPPLVRIVGWIYAREGKLAEYWRERGEHGERSAYFAPQEILRPISTLPREDEDG